MMKKFFAILMIAVLALSATAFAATYTSDDISFEYDDSAFEIAMDDRTDDETLVILDGKNEAWGNTYIRIYLAELRDGETVPTMEEFAEMPDTEVTQGEWNGYSDVFMYTLNNEDDGSSQHFFIAPLADEDDGEVEDLLTVEISITDIEDEDVAMERDDLISAVVDSLRIDD